MQTINRIFLLTLALVVGLSLLAACGAAEDRALAQRIEAVLRSNYEDSYVYTITTNGEGVDVLVQWYASSGPATSGLELMVPEEADHHIWDALTQQLAPEDLARITSVYFQRVEDQ